MQLSKKDILYVFACGVRMLRDKDIQAAREVASSIDDPDEGVRELAGFFLHEASLQFTAIGRRVSGKGAAPNAYVM